ncbi:DUF2207 domain-containing protein, partial [Patescibacteria group bacterium]
MTKRLKLFLSLLFTGIIAILAISFSFAQSEQIEGFYSEITVNEDGTINVKETIKYNFQELPDKHGIYRFLDYKRENLQGKNYILNTDVLQITNDKGTPYQFQESKKGDYIRLKIGDANQTITGIHTYVVTYKVSGALTYFSDHDELFWNISGTEWPVSINRVEGKIILPKDIPSNKIDVVCYEGWYGSSSQSCSTYIGDHDARAISSRTFSSGENLSIAVSFPKGYVTELKARRDTSGFLQIVFIILAGMFVLFWYVFLPLKILRNYLKDKKNTKEKQQIVAAWFSPPKDGRKKFTPAETGLVLDKVTDHKEVTASLIDLAQRGYLKIIQVKKKKFKFEKLKEFKNDKSLKEYEKTLLEGIFGDKKETELNKLKSNTKFHTKLNEFQKQLEQTVMDMGMFHKEPSKVATNNIVLGVLGLIIFNPILMIVAFAFGQKSAQRTDLGIDKYSKAKSLLNFLKSQDEQLDFQAKNQMFFEKLLPYATVFGVEDIWAKRFEDLKFKPPEWYDGDIQNAAMYSAFNRNFSSSVRTATGPTSTTIINIGLNII